MAEILVGESIPLTCQLHDGNSTRDVRARVYDSLGLLISQVKLQHFEGGLYMSKSVTMPDDKFVVAQYEVIDSSDYVMASELFKAIPKPSPEPKHILGEVIAKIKNDSIIVGEVVHGEKKITDFKRI